MTTIQYCPNKFNNNAKFNEFRYLNENGKKLIQGWFERASEIYRDDEKIYEAFIFTWFAFNGWATCLATNADTDAAILEVISKNKKINKDFDSLLSSNSDFAENAKKFLDFLPIFDARKLNKYYGDSNSNWNRKQQVDDYYLLLEEKLNNNRELLKSFAPKCWRQHIEKGEEIPFNWAHIIWGIYKVRCNLFHGQKDGVSDINYEIVKVAFLTLYHFLNETDYLLIEENKQNNG